jgi:hypothetical protein
VDKKVNVVVPNCSSKNKYISERTIASYCRINHKKSSTRTIDNFPIFKHKLATRFNHQKSQVNHPKDAQ